MSIEAAIDDTPPSAPAPNDSAPAWRPDGAAGGRFGDYARRAGSVCLGVAILLVMWWIGGWIVASDPATVNFAGFAPAPTLKRLWQMLLDGEAMQNDGAEPRPHRRRPVLGRSPSACRSESSSADSARRAMRVGCRFSFCG